MTSYVCVGAGVSKFGHVGEFDSPTATRPPQRLKFLQWFGGIGERLQVSNSIRTCWYMPWFCWSVCPGSLGFHRINKHWSHYIDRPPSSQVVAWISLVDIEFDLFGCLGVGIDRHIHVYPCLSQYPFWMNSHTWGVQLGVITNGLVNTSTNTLLDGTVCGISLLSTMDA